MSRQVLVVGLTCLDVVTYCTDGFPIEDTETLSEQQTWSLGGNACNNVTVLRQLGVDCRLVSAIAADPLTRPLVERLFVDVGLDPRITKQSVFVRPTGSTATSVVIINPRQGTRTILHQKGTFAEPTVEEFIAASGDPSDYSWVHFEGRNVIEVRRMMDYLLDGKRQRKAPMISLELEKPHEITQLETLVRGVDVVFVSKDVSIAKGYTNMQEAVERLMVNLPELKAGATVICPWGDLGAAAGRNLSASAGYEIVTCGAFPPASGTVVDSLAAGDTFNAGTIYALDRGLPLQGAITFGCKLAANKCGQRSLKSITIPTI